MKALSFSRPWDMVILHHPFKNVENRKWPTKYRGRIHVHRAKSWDQRGFEWLWKYRQALHIDESVFPEMLLLKVPVCQGELVGEVDIVDCISESSSPWFFGPYGLVLSDPFAYEKVIPYRGALGLFEVHL
jgi:hypothetical protein